MSEIKRYKHAYGGNYDEMELATDGEWVRWEDMKDLLPTKPRAMTSEDIQRGMEHVIDDGTDRIECRKIEWESKGTTRVADYFVPYRRRSDVYFKQTHFIGSQPEGSVLVPGSERDDS